MHRLVMVIAIVVVSSSAEARAEARWHLGAGAGIGAQLMTSATLDDQGEDPTVYAVGAPLLVRAAYGTRWRAVGSLEVQPLGFDDYFRDTKRRWGVWLLPGVERRWRRATVSVFVGATRQVYSTAAVGCEPSCTRWDLATGASVGVPIGPVVIELLGRSAQVPPFSGHDRFVGVAASFTADL
jgi:hypothetical protein